MDISESDAVRATAFSTLATLTRRPVGLPGGVQRMDVSRAMTICELIVLRSSSLLNSSSSNLISAVAAALDSVMMIVPQDALRLLLKGDVFQTTWHHLLSYLERRPSSNYFEDSDSSSSLEYLNSVCYLCVCVFCTLTLFTTITSDNSPTITHQLHTHTLDTRYVE